MRRWFVNSLTVFSLLICMATGALWVRSYWRYDEVTFRLGDAGGGCCYSMEGNLQFYLPARQNDVKGQKWTADWVVVDKPNSSMWIFERYLFAEHAKRARYRLGGFGIVSNRLGRTICARHWMLALLFGIMPLAALLKKLMHRRTMSGGPGRESESLRPPQART